MSLFSCEKLANWGEVKVSNPDKDNDELKLIAVMDGFSHGFETFPNYPEREDGRQLTEAEKELYDRAYKLAFKDGQEARAKHERGEGLMER